MRKDNWDKITQPTKQINKKTGSLICAVKEYGTKDFRVIKKRPAVYWNIKESDHRKIYYPTNLQLVKKEFKVCFTLRKETINKICC